MAPGDELWGVEEQGLQTPLPELETLPEAGLHRSAPQVRRQGPDDLCVDDRPVPRIIWMVGVRPLVRKSRNADHLAHPEIVISRIDSQ